MAQRYENMRDILAQIREGYSPKEIKMAIGIASDPRYKGGNYTGAVNAIEKIKKGLSKHPQVAAVLKRQNEDVDPSDTGGEEEVSMAMTQLAGIRHFVDGIEMRVKSAGDMEEWYQNKLTKAHDYLKTIYAYGKGDVAESLEEAKEVLSRFRDDKLKQNTINLAKQSGLKVKDMGDKIEISGNARRVMDITLAVQKQDVKIEELEEAMLNLKLVTYQAKEALGKIRHKVAKKGNKYIISVDSNDEEDAQKAMKDHPLYVAGKLRVVPESVEEQVEIEEKLKVSDGLGAWIDDFKKSDAPQFKGKSDEEKKNMAIAAFTDAGGKLESVKEEEEPQKPDSAKEVEQGREDKKKTRIAQLQLQIAKAQETINKLNSQEK